MLARGAGDRASCWITRPFTREVVRGEESKGIWVMAERAKVLEAEHEETSSAARKLSLERGEVAPLNVTARSNTEVSRTAQSILNDIAAGKYEVDGRLPAERQLAAMMGVSRATIREALSVLEVLGVVEVQHGSGAYVRMGTGGMVRNVIRWQLELGYNEYVDVLQVRSSLEVLAARLAATAVHQSKEPMRLLEPLSQTLLGQETALREENQADFVRYDAAYHVELGELSGNRTLAELLSTLRGLLKVWLEHSAKEREDQELAYKEHLAVYREIQMGRSNAAAKLMWNHMVSGSDRLIAANLQATDRHLFDESLDAPEPLVGNGEIPD
ncbi:hypothetical protein ACU21_05680 [Actinobaculum suis]|nr:hypothetical protein ACU20_06240 [Actinobaculum suis]OCA94815.1 hypothetical protein ACU21_05680 [Actinobaculum suis]